VDRLEVELENGQHSHRDILRHAGGVGVLARRPDGCYLLVRQFRKALEQLVVEIVAGMRDPGETAAQAVRRELMEETGYRAVKLEHIGRSFASPGYTDEVVELFFAETDATPSAIDLDHDERVEVLVLSGDELSAWMSEGRVSDSKSVVAWFLAGQRGLL